MEDIEANMQAVCVAIDPSAATFAWEWEYPVPLERPGAKKSPLHMWCLERFVGYWMLLSSGDVALVNSKTPAYQPKA